MKKNLENPKKTLENSKKFRRILKNYDCLTLVRENRGIVNEYNHDTIGMIAFDQHGTTAAGTTTNGLTHKISGNTGGPISTTF